jgi:hypothetical protein
MVDETQAAATTQSAPRKRGFNPFRPIGPWPPGYILLWILTMASVVINVILLRQILLARQIALASVRESIHVLENLQTQVINYEVQIDETLPIKTDVPINMTVPITIRDDFEINTSVTASIPAGPLGSIPVRVPVSTTVPIDKTFNIEIDQVLTIDTTIPVKFNVPLSFSVEQLGLFATIEETKARLQLLEQSLSSPLLPFLPGPDTSDDAGDPPAIAPTSAGGDSPTPTAKP